MITLSPTRVREPVAPAATILADVFHLADFNLARWAIQMMQAPMKHRRLSKH
jgi:hypothetical protein